MATTINGEKATKELQTVELYDPFAEFTRMSEGLKPLLGWLPAAQTAFRTPAFTFDLDVYEKDGMYVVECALPGMKKENIEIQASGKALTITARSDEMKKEDRPQYFYRERQRGEFLRSLTFPEPIDPKKVEAEYEHGILKVKIPAPKAAQAERIGIKG